MHCQKCQDSLNYCAFRKAGCVSHRAKFDDINSKRAGLRGDFGKHLTKLAQSQPAYRWGTGGRQNRWVKHVDVQRDETGLSGDLA